MLNYKKKIKSNFIFKTNDCCFRAVFTWNNLLVVVAECQGPEAEALDLIPAITSSVGIFVQMKNEKTLNARTDFCNL